MTKNQLFSGQIKKAESQEILRHQEGWAEIQTKKLWTFCEDHFHKINYNKLSILDNKPVLYCIIVW